MTKKGTTRPPSKARPASGSPQKIRFRYAKQTKLSGVTLWLDQAGFESSRMNTARTQYIGVILICTECMVEVARIRFDDVKGLSNAAIIAGLKFTKGPVIIMAERLAGDIYCSEDCVDVREVKGALAQ